MQIILGTIRNQDETAQWLGYLIGAPYPFAEMLTVYLISYVDMLPVNAPALYYGNADYQEDDPSPKRASIIHSVAAQLEKCNLMKYEHGSQAAADASTAPN